MRVLCVFPCLLVDFAPDMCSPRLPVRLPVRCFVLIAGTFFCGLILFSANSTKTLREFVTVLIFMLNLGFCGVALHCGVAGTYAELKERQSHRSSAEETVDPFSTRSTAAASMELTPRNNPMYGQ